MGERRGREECARECCGTRDETTSVITAAATASLNTHTLSFWKAKQKSKIASAGF